MAHVHVVIAGFGHDDVPVKRLYAYDEQATASVTTGTAPIGPYLTPRSASFVTQRRQPISPIPEMRCGNHPSDDGYFIFTDAERSEFLRLEPRAKKIFRRFTGSEELINGSMRWCLWLKDAPLTNYAPCRA